MLGGIYSDQVCPVCGGRFKHSEAKGLFCPDHPGVQPRSYKVIFGKITRRFSEYGTAFRFLTGLRWEKDRGSFDPRDYLTKEKPLAFSTLAAGWLEVKARTVKRSSYRNLKGYVERAISAWGDMNIKAIGYAEIEDFLLAQDVSAKTRANICSGLHGFWMWLVDRDIIEAAQVPKFPKVTFALGWRKTIDRETQAAIIQEVRRQTEGFNPKVWIAIHLLAHYVSMRPSELLNIREGDIDRNRGLVLIPSPKEREPKLVWLLEEDAALLSQFPQGLPHLFFFRHGEKISSNSVKPGQKFALTMLYRWWKRACKALEIDGVDLYGGTRHSTLSWPCGTWPHLKQSDGSPAAPRTRPLSGTTRRAPGRRGTSRAGSGLITWVVTLITR